MTTVAAGTAAVGRRQRVEEPEWVVWLLVLLLLGVGFMVGTVVAGQTQGFHQGSISLSYPVSWSAVAGQTPFDLLRVADTLSPAQFPPNLVVRQMPAAEINRNAKTPADLALAWSTAQANELSDYNVLNMESVTVDGQAGIALDYAYVATPLITPGAAGIPIVARAQDILVLQDGTATIITFADEASAYQDDSAIWRRILTTVRLAGK